MVDASAACADPWSVWSAYAAWFGAIATFLAVIVALFREDIMQRFHHPKLTARIKMGSPDCQLTHMESRDVLGKLLFRSSVYYFRLWIANEGDVRAEQVQVFVAKLQRRNPKGEFETQDWFLPLNLIWTHTREVFASGISPRMGKHVDLGHVVDPYYQREAGEILDEATPSDALFALELEVKPNTRSHLLLPGEYRLELLIGAANTDPTPVSLLLTVSSEWFTSEEEMFSKGVSIRMGD